jgi:hypothetical protein
MGRGENPVSWLGAEEEFVFSARRKVNSKLSTSSKGLKTVSATRSGMVVEKAAQRSTGN